MKRTNHSSLYLICLMICPTFFFGCPSGGQPINDPEVADKVADTNVAEGVFEEVAEDVPKDVVDVVEVGDLKPGDVTEEVEVLAETETTEDVPGLDAPDAAVDIPPDVEDVEEEVEVLYTAPPEVCEIWMTESNGSRKLYVKGFPEGTYFTFRCENEENLPDYWCNLIDMFPVTDSEGNLWSIIPFYVNAGNIRSPEGKWYYTLPEYCVLTPPLEWHETPEGGYLYFGLPSQFK